MTTLSSGNDVQDADTQHVLAAAAAAASAGAGAGVAGGMDSPRRIVDN